MAILNTLMEVYPEFQKISSTTPCVIRNVNFVILIASKINGQFVRNFTDTFDDEFRRTMQILRVRPIKENQDFARPSCYYVCLQVVHTCSHEGPNSLFTQLYTRCSRL